MFICNICVKKYKSQDTLNIHNKKYHNTIPTNTIQLNHTLMNTSPTNTTQNNIDNINHVRMYKCAYCIKEYRHKQSKWTHEQKCKLINKTKTKDIINADLIAIEKMKLSLEIIKEEARILELKSKLEKSEKIDNITLKKLNRILQERNNRIKNSTINSHNTNTNIQNYITNNFQIIQLGKENIIDKLSLNEKKLIMNAKFCSFNKLKTKFLVY